MKKRVFLDTNIIIESFRIAVWQELSQAWLLETVHKCEEEALTGETSRASRVLVDAQLLRAGLNKSHFVGRAERNKLIAAHPLCAGLDDGEKDLFSHIHAQNIMPGLLLVSTADKGAIVRANELGWLSQLISLEELLRKTTAAQNKVAFLGEAYSERFLSSVRTKVILKTIP